MAQEMTLPQAIRLGATMKPQAFGAVFDGRGTCAWGAAMDACGRLDANRPVNTEFQEWGDDPGPRVPCPVSRCAASLFPSGTPRGLIMHLNDGHQWTRNQIADWLEAIEDAQSAQSTLDEHPISEEVTA